MDYRSTSLFLDSFDPEPRVSDPHATFFAIGSEDPAWHIGRTEQQHRFPGKHPGGVGTPHPETGAAERLHVNCPTVKVSTGKFVSNCIFLPRPVDHDGFHYDIRKVCRFREGHCHSPRAAEGQARPKVTERAREMHAELSLNFVTVVCE